MVVLPKPLRQYSAPRWKSRPPSPRISDMFRPVAFAVDDEAGILSAIRRTLWKSPIDLRCFGSPTEALSALEGLCAPGTPARARPAAVVSDFRMPVMSGIELLERFRELSPETTRILLTGYVDLESSIAAINRGSVYRLVGKPWDEDALKGAILSGVAECVAARASGALRNLLRSLIGIPTGEAALAALSRFLDEESGLGLAPPEGEAAAADPRAPDDGALVLPVQSPEPGGGPLSVKVPRGELALFETAGLSRAIADMIESSLDGFRIALEAIWARRSLVELSERDPLSGLLNRRAMSARLEVECHRQDRYGSPLSILLIDVDEFKHINDRYGHAKGDMVIAGIGKAISATCRTIDIGARLGGDEFLVGAPETDAAGARKLATRLAERAASLGEELGLEKRLTLSIGVSLSEGGNSCVDGILEAADESMYEVKRRGRNGIGEARGP